MAGNVKFEMSSVSPEDSGFSGNYPNGQRGNYPGPSLDRSGSFREGRSDGRAFSSGTGTSKVADLPPLSQCLLLDPIAMGEQKYTRAGELRRALGFSFRNVSEDNAFGATHSKPPPTLATDELKRFRASVSEGSLKARNRVKRLEESLNKLNKYCEALNSKKQQPNERSGGSLKMGSQSHRSSPDLATQKLEERNKNVVLSKRARTPIGDMRIEGRSIGVPRQHAVLGKDKDAAKEGSSDLIEEKMRRFPTGGEGWEKKMKRRRSVSSVFPRSLDGDGEPKRNMHGRLGNDSVIQSSDSHGFRSGASNGANGINKPDRTPSPASLGARMTPKNELEKASLSRELTVMNKEILLQKENSKLNMREDTHLFSPSSVTKGKASRAHRAGPAAVGNSSPNLPRLSGTPEDWEQPVNVNKVHSLAGVNNRKRPLPTESSSPPMAQWVGQRPQKISRNRRTNIVSPTSNQDEMQMSSEGCNASDFSPRIPVGMNGSFPVRNMTSTSQQLKVKLESAPSPARLCENEENSAVENRLKDKALGGLEMDERGIDDHQHVSPSGLFTKKNKLVVKEEIGDGVRRQGRSGRGSSFSRGNISPSREKLENQATAKPVRGARSGSEKNGSKSGRPPLKKHSDRKGFTRLGSVPSTPDFTGESDDDREELLAAAHFACNASYNGCSSSFWKRMEPLFYVSLEDKSFLEKQLTSIEEHKPNQGQMAALDDNIVNYALQIEHSGPQSFVSGESKKFISDHGLTESASTGDLINQFQDHGSSYRGLGTENGPNSLTPLYQRVLSALIVEDVCEEYEEFDENCLTGNAISLADRDDPCTVADRISCNGNATHFRFSVHEEIEEGNYNFTHPVGQAGPRPLLNDVNGSLDIPVNAPSDSLLESQYDQMCMNEKLVLELQSIGIYPETVPYLAEGEDELINQDIAQLKKQVCQQAGKKTTYLGRIHKAIEEKKEVEGRDLELLAINRLTELAYKKLLATRGSSAARLGISKVPRHVALAFIKKTLARCRKFEDTGTSCFSDPALRDALLAAPSYNSRVVNQAEQNMRLEVGALGFFPADKSERGSFDAYEALSHQSDHAFAKNGPILNRGKKKEVLLDDVGGNGAMRSTSTLGSTLLGGAKGKRSERDSGAKIGRPSITNLRGERKTKSKPKQKAALLSSHPVQSSVGISNELVANGSNRKQGLISPGNIFDSSSKENKESMDLSNLPLHELDSIEDLGVANGFDGPQDLSSWLNFDEDGLQDHDSIGLEIPMDDLSMVL